jgi:hypothetical protein
LVPLGLSWGYVGAFANEKTPFVKKKEFLSKVRGCVFCGGI